MSFTAFEKTIVSPALKIVALHWNDVRGARKMPGWSNIKPGAIAPHLPVVWSYKYDRANDSFTGRLAGERITAIFGKSLRGVAMSEIYPASDYPALFARSKRVVTEPTFMRGHGLVFRHLGHYGTGERIILPLADDGENGDGMIGATEYRTVFEPARDLLATEEAEEWFALG